MTREFRGGPDTQWHGDGVGAKIYALQKHPGALFEWRFGENDARTLAYEVAAAATPPLQNTFVVVIPDTPWPLNGVCRFRRAVWALPCFLSHLIGK